VIRCAMNVVEENDDRFRLLKTKMRQNIDYARF
jgi:hypothetical protein